MRINEIFYSIQGEGAHAGTPCVFVRFSGCNLKCPFCDTKHETFQEMTEDEVLAEIDKYPTRHVILTGGEPSLQITRSFMVDLGSRGHCIHVETNGTRNNPALDYAHWITCSPKFEFCKNAEVKVGRIDELKVVYDDSKTDMDAYEGISAGMYYIQPCDTGDPEQNERNVQAAVAYCLAHPKWRLSLQTQKIINVK